jgi:hemin uptake protein HemP
MSRLPPISIRGMPPKEPCIRPRAESAIPKCIPSEILLQGEQAVQISHMGQIYWLKITIRGGLILQK